MRWLVALLMCMMPPVIFGAVPLRGINLSGAELGADKLPGRSDTDYFYPSGEEIRRWAGLGMTALRVPVLWERLQPALNSALDAGELARLRAVISAAGPLGVTIIVDVHDYGAYRGRHVGENGVSASAFAEFWSRLARRLGQDRVAFGLMNEPNGIAAPDWAAVEQAAVNAIRVAGAGNLILVSGTGWDGAHNFVSGDGYGASNATALAGLIDPRRNMVVEMHQYFDHDFSGTHADCADPAQGVALLAPATAWLRAHHLRGMLGEFGVTRDGTCLSTLQAVLSYLDKNEDAWLGWTYWAAGRWWGNYMFSAEPSGGHEPPQLAVLRAHLRPRLP